jgi:glycosyltransferase involved in cell wall biosynthesis
MDIIDVSIVIPTYNRLFFLKEAIASFSDKLNCSYEVIIADDGSSDGTPEFLKTLHGPFKVVLADHSGPAATRNKALNYVTGRYIIFLDDDDLLSPACVDAQMAYLDSHPDVTMCYTDWGYVARTTSGRERRWLFIMEEIKDAIDALIIDWWCPAFANMFRKDGLTGLTWDNSSTYLADFSFVSDVALTGAKFGYVNAEHTSVGWYRAILNKDMRLSQAPNLIRTRAELQVLEKIRQNLYRNNVLTEERKHLLATRYFQIARRVYPDDRILFRKIIQQVLELNPAFQAEGPHYRWLIRNLGYEQAEWLRRTRLALVAKLRKLNRTKRSKMPLDGDSVRIVKSTGKTVLPKVEG